MTDGGEAGVSRRHQAARNRERMPETAAIVDAFRAAFGPGLRVIWAKEGPDELGKPSARLRTMDANQWLAYLATGIWPADELPLNPDHDDAALSSPC